MNCPGESRWILAFGLASTLVPAIGARASEMPDDPLVHDPRLDLKVTMAEKDRPLGEILSGLRHQIKVPLRASREVADDRATLFLNDQPAAEVMGLVARQFDFQWYRSGNGYELGQSIASRNREAALREQALEAQWSAVESQMERRPALADTPHGRLVEREAEVVQRLRGEDLDESEREHLDRERALIVDALHPGRAPAQAIFRTLTPNQIRKLLAGRDLWLSGADGTMPPRIAEVVHQAQRDALKLASWAPFLQLFARDTWPPKGAEVVVRLIDTANYLKGPPPRGEPHLRLLFLVPVGPEVDRRRSAFLGWEADGKREGIPPEPVTATDDPALQRSVALSWPQPGPTTTQEDSPHDQPLDSETWPRSLPTLGDLGEALHRATGLEIVADSFTRARPDAKSAAALQGHPQPVLRILNEIADKLDYSWRKEDNRLFFRSRHWYQDRAEEVPERILRPWRQRVRRAGAASLDDLAGLAAALTDDQARGLQEYWGWYLAETPALPPSQGIGGFYACRHHLRFWASLTPPQQFAARRGAILPVARMSLRQRQAFDTALESNDGAIAAGDLWRPATPEEIAAGGFQYENGSPETTFHTFAYYLAGEPTAAREVGLSIPWPARPQSEP